MFLEKKHHEIKNGFLEKQFGKINTDDFFAFMSVNVRKCNLINVLCIHEVQMKDPDQNKYRQL